MIQLNNLQKLIKVFSNFEIPKMPSKLYNTILLSSLL